MPTANQLRRKLKKQVSTKDIMRKITTSTIVNRRTGEKKPKTFDLPDTIWDDPPEVMKIREEDVHRRAWIAGKPSTFDSKIVEVRVDPEKGAPQADLLVTDRRSERGIGSHKSCFLDQLLLHPDELTEDRLSEFYDIEDKRKS